MKSCVSTNFGLSVALVLCAAPAWAQAPQQEAQPPGAISGRVMDDTGAVVAGVKVLLWHEAISSRSEVVSGETGQFFFANVPPGPYRLTVSAPGFAEQTLSGVLGSGEAASLAPIRLTLAFGALAVDVTSTRVELAQRQIEQQEQQRLFGVLPNFYVSYIPDAAPLNTRQKFELSWKSRLDPVRFAVAGMVAGIQHARDVHPGFGDGVEGYAKRYAANYANGMTRSLITQVLLPSLFKQDPRYFYKGTGSTKSRIGYAVSRAVVKKGDNGRWQPNYSGVLGSLASGAISNLYYPAEERKGVQLTLENTALGLGGAALGHLAQEFLFKRLTSRGKSAPGGARSVPPNAER